MWPADSSVWCARDKPESGAPPGYALNPEHQWEIGHGGISAGDVSEWIGEAGFRLERDYRPFENPLHHFVVLRVG